MQARVRSGGGADWALGLEAGPVKREAAGLSTPSLLQNSSKNRKSKERKGEKRKEWTTIWAWGLFSRTHNKVLVPRK